MDLFTVLKDQLQNENQNQVNKTLETIDEKYLISTEYEYTADKHNTSTIYNIEFNDDQLELYIHTSLKIVKGSSENETYKGSGILITTTTLTGKDFPVANYRLYRLDGIIEECDVDYNLEPTNNNQKKFCKLLNQN